MLVKICGITTHEDAEAAIEAGATALGFNFYPKSPRYITPQNAAAITVQLPASIIKAGVFVNEPPEVVTEIAAQAKLNAVQLHGGQAPNNVTVWRALSVGPDFDMSLLDAEQPEAFLLDTPSGNQHGGTGRTFDWNRITATQKRIILAGGLDASNVAQAIATVHPWGVDSCSRIESSPGKKDKTKMTEFVKAALEAGKS
jgi:phosphoribosylanthranilate isomerase